MTIYYRFLDVINESEGLKNGLKKIVTEYKYYTFEDQSHCNNYLINYIENHLGLKEPVLLIEICEYLIQNADINSIYKLFEVLEKNKLNIIVLNRISITLKESIKRINFSKETFFKNYQNIVFRSLNYLKDKNELKYKWTCYHSNEIIKYLVKKASEMAYFEKKERQHIL